jgi:hypothetical protein
MVSIFSDPPPGFASTMDGRRHHLFEFLVTTRLVIVELALDGSAQEIVPSLAHAIDAVHTTQQVVWEFDLKLGHLASVSRGFG